MSDLYRHVTNLADGGPVVEAVTGLAQLAEELRAGGRERAATAVDTGLACLRHPPLSELVQGWVVTVQSHERGEALLPYVVTGLDVPMRAVLVTHRA